MTDLSYSFGARLRDLAVEVGVKEDFYDAIRDLLRVSTSSAASGPTTAQQSSTLKVDSDPWVSIGSVTAGIMGATVVCLGVRSLATMWSWRRSLREAETRGAGSRAYAIAHIGECSPTPAEVLPHAL